MGKLSTEMIQEVSGSLFRLIRGITRNRDEALDLTQDVLLRMVDRSVPDDPSHFKGYAMRAAYHIALNAVRDRRRQAQLREQLQHDPAARGDCAPDRDCPDRITLRHLHQALGQLPEKQREAVELRFYGGLTVAETSLSMGISEGSVKVHLFRALHRLNELMGSSNEEKLR
jgi:RNA polymerase sigma-70 factor, ECF subfamily